jgi:hypothetical protein
VCWKPRSSCWSFHLLREEFLSAPIHSPPLWFAVSVLQLTIAAKCCPYGRNHVWSPRKPPKQKIICRNYSTQWEFLRVINTKLILYSSFSVFSPKTYLNLEPKSLTIARKPACQRPPPSARSRQQLDSRSDAWSVRLTKRHCARVRDCKGDDRHLSPLDFRTSTFEPSVLRSALAAWRKVWKLKSSKPSMSNL